VFHRTEPTPVSRDLNSDGVVDRLDLAILMQNYRVAAGADVSDGDFNGNGRIDLTDLLLFKWRYGQSETNTETFPVAVPEPSASILSTIMLLLWFLIHLKRRR
jgi:hypothetical protein